MKRFPEGGQMLDKGASDGFLYPFGGFFILEQSPRAFRKEAKLPAQILNAWEVTRIGSRGEHLMLTGPIAEMFKGAKTTLFRDCPDDACSGGNAIFLENRLVSK